MKLACIALALSLALVACSEDEPAPTDTVDVSVQDASSDATADAERAPRGPKTPTDPTVDASTCPTRNARRYVGTPTSCVEIFVICEAGETSFANACGCGCERAE